MRLYVRNNGKIIKFAKRLGDIENTNDLGEHFFECTNDVGC
jgi:hypothetical protein